MSQALIHSSTVRFEAAIAQLVAAKRSEHTRTAYRHEAKRWSEFCAANAIDPIAPALGHAVFFRDTLAKQLSNDSVYRALAALSSLYSGLATGGAVAHNPFAPNMLAWPKQSREGKTAMLTDDEIEKILAVVADLEDMSGIRDHAIIRLLVDTGLRRESIASIERANYKPPSLKVTVKGGYERTIELLPETIAVLDAWCASGAGKRFMFPAVAYPSRGDRHISPTMVTKIVRSIGEAAGIPRVHPHRFRASFITAAYDAGIPEYEIQAAAGHSDPHTTRRYDRGARGLGVAAKVAEHRRSKPKKGPTP